MQYCSQLLSFATMIVYVAM